MNRKIIFLLIASGLIFSSCSRKSRYYYSQPTTYSASKDSYNTAISPSEEKYAKLSPYVVMGKKYYPQKVNVGERFSGKASWYGPDFHGKLTANGESYNMYDNTAAHKTFPMNTMVKVTNQNNGLSAIVRINDRGPFVGTRIIDLSNTAAKKINMIGSGTAPVSLEVLGYYSKNKVNTPNVKKQEAKQVSQYKKQETSLQSQYFLQIASFTNIEGAIRVQEEFNGTDGYTTIIKDIEGVNGRVFKVCLKGFKTEREIREYKSNSEFSNAFILIQ